MTAAAKLRNVKRVKGFGLRLRQARKNAKYTTGEIARTLGTTIQTIGNWESGRNDPSLVVLCEMARLFGVSVDFLFGISTEENDGK